MSSTAQSVVLRRRIHVGGIVQGVGFRPFVYNLAQHHKIQGHVLNCSSGVVIEIEGVEPALDAFIHSLTSQPPPLARIETLQSSMIDSTGEKGFLILESARATGEFASATAAESRRSISGWARSPV